MFDKILNSPLEPVTIQGKISVLDVQQDLEFTFVLIILAILLPICLLNLINIFHHISINAVSCTVKSICH